MDAYWRAANYLSVGQIYLLDNPLVKEPLTREHIKPRLLGHWGTVPGLNMVYTHCDRLIREQDLDMIFVTGPGHGGPAIVAQTWLEGSWTDTYPGTGRDERGMGRLFRQFSFPGGIPSHVAQEVPGSIHEGGELGYSLSHACGAAFDNPDLIVTTVVGDGEAETGALATGWSAARFLDPRTDGAVLPVLHLNGYKIANPTLLARIPEDDLESLLRGHGWDPVLVAGDDPASVHQQMAAALRRIQRSTVDQSGGFWRLHVIAFLDRPAASNAIVLRATDVTDPRAPRYSAANRCRRGGRPPHGRAPLSLRHRAAKRNARRPYFTRNAPRMNGCMRQKYV